MIREVVAVGFALLMVSSVATGTVAAGAVGSAGEADAATADVQETTNESADDIYRYGNGSAVLVYEGESSGEDVSTAQYGADVSTGLVDLIVVSEPETQQEVTGELGIEMTPDTIAGDGQLAFESPESVESLDASVSGTLTPEENTAEMSLDMTVRGGERAPQADSTGEIVVGADSFAVDAEYAAEGLGSTGVDQSRVVRMTEIDNGYEVEFHDERPINPLIRERWNTSEAATQTISQQYQAIARQLGGSAEVTIQSYDYTESSDGNDRLDIEYTVTMNDVKEGLMRQLAEQIAASEQVELSPDERQALEESLMDLTVEQVALAQNQTESGAQEGFVDMEITNYENSLLTYLGAFASEDGPINDSDVETLRQQFEARSVADLEQTVSWDATVAAESSTTTSIEAQVNYDTTNWNAYTDELADRGMPVETDIQFEGSAQTTDGNIEMQMSFDVTQEQLVDSAIGELSDTAEAEGEDESTVEAFRSLENAEFKVAKADLVFNRDRVEVRAAAQFDDLSEFDSAIDEMPEDSSIRQIYGEGGGDGTTTYVYVEGLDVSDEQLRETALANEDTTIHAAGEWDRSFPVMDVQSTADYLGVDVEVNNPPHGAPDGAETGEETATPSPTPSPTPTESGGMETDTPADTDTETSGDTPTPTSTFEFGPGFGPVVALLALLAGALFARRRR